MGVPLFLRAVVVSLVAAAVCYAQPMRADVVIMANGDQFTGTVVKLEDGKLVLAPAYSEPISLKWDDVKRVSVMQPLVLPTAKQNLSVTAIERTDSGIVATTAYLWR